MLSALAPGYQGRTWNGLIAVDFSQPKAAFPFPNMHSLDMLYTGTPVARVPVIPCRGKTPMRPLNGARLGCDLVAAVRHIFFR